MGRALRISGSKAAFDVYDPKSMDERKKVAQRFEQALEYRIPILVDEIDDPVNKTYAALPTRLYLINKIGIIVYAGGLGPFGFKPSELKLAIDQLLGEYE